MHCELLDLENNNLDYVVINGDKKALFKLKNRADKFKDINIKIAEYFGLPKGKIFLKNIKEEILLSNNLVVDELFPLKTSKIKNQDPKIFVTFQKNMSSLEFILGMEKEKEMQRKQREDEEKEHDK
jgi:hypothetical protein